MSRTLLSCCHCGQRLSGTEVWRDEHTYSWAISEAVLLKIQIPCRLYKEVVLGSSLLQFLH